MYIGTVRRSYGPGMSGLGVSLPLIGEVSATTLALAGAGLVALMFLMGGKKKGGGGGKREGAAPLTRTTTRYA